MYIAFAIVGLFIFFAMIYPRYFDKAQGGSVKAPLRRGRSQLIDMEVPGIISEIVEIKTLENGTVDYHLWNRNGRYLRNYQNEDVIPLNPSQVAVDSEGPIFITKGTKYSHTEYGKEIDKLNARVQELTVQLDTAVMENELIKANTQVEVDKQIDRFKDMQQKRTPDWTGQKQY